MSELIYNDKARADLITKYKCCYSDMMKKALEAEMFDKSNCDYFEKALFIKRTADILEGFVPDGTIVSYTSDGSATVDLSGLNPASFEDGMQINITSDYIGGEVLANFIYDGLGDVDLEAFAAETVIQINAGGSGYTADAYVAMSEEVVINVPTTLPSLPTGTTIIVAFAPVWQAITSLAGDEPTIQESPVLDSEHSYIRGPGLKSKNCYVPGVGPFAANGGLIYKTRLYGSLQTMTSFNGLSTPGAWPATGDGWINHDFNGVDITARVVNTGPAVQVLTVPSNLSSVVFKEGMRLRLFETSVTWPRAELDAVVTAPGLVGTSLTVTVEDTNERGLGTFISAALPVGSTEWSVSTYLRDFPADGTDHNASPGIVDILSWDGATDTLALETSLEVDFLGYNTEAHYSQSENKVFIAGTYNGLNVFVLSSGIAYVDLAVDPLVIANTIETKTQQVGIVNTETTTFPIINGSGFVTRLGEVDIASFTALLNQADSLPFSPKDGLFTADENTKDVYYFSTNNITINKMSGFGGDFAVDPSITHTPVTILDLAVLGASFTENIAFDSVNNLLWVHCTRTVGPNKLGFIMSLDVNAGSSAQVFASRVEYPHPSESIGQGPHMVVHRGTPYLTVRSTSNDVLIFNTTDKTWISNPITPPSGMGQCLGMQDIDSTNDRILFSTGDNTTTYANTWVAGPVTDLATSQGTVTGTVTPNLFDGTKNCLTEAQIAGLIEYAQKFCCECSNC